MHGLILAGGLGSRLSADGVAEPKPLVRIGGRPQLLRLCETLEALGCETVTCLVRDGVPADAVITPARGRARRRAIACDTPSSLHTLVLGFEALPPGPVFCTMVDTVMAWDDWRAVWNAWETAAAQEVLGLLAIARPSERETHPLYVQVDGAGWVRAVGARAPTTSLVTAGVYGFGPAARPLAAQAIDRGLHRMRGFLATLAADGRRLQAVRVSRALDLDRRDDLDEANAWAPAVSA